MLYKKDINSKILSWRAFYEYIDGCVNIVIQAGEFLGKKTEHKILDIKGKNIGKSNETSSIEQASKEIESLITAKMRKGYVSYPNLSDEADVVFEETLQRELKYEQTDLDGNVAPMLCQQYYRSKKNWKDPSGELWDDRKYYYLKNYQAEKEAKAIIINFPCYNQPKVNGARCTVSLHEDKGVQLLSKLGLSYDIPHIKSFFEQRLHLFENGRVFDGELYIPNEPLQVISSAIKSNNLDTSRLVYIIFDLAIKNVVYEVRKKELESLIDINNTIKPTSVYLIETTTVMNDLDVQALTDIHIKNGYEGSILRNPKGLYAFGKRPMDIVKLKRVIDDEFKIIDVVPQAKKPDLGLFVCVTSDGKQFEVNPKGNTLYKELVLRMKSNFIGKPLTCTFYEYTEDKIPFHIIDNIVRDYE